MKTKKIILRESELRALIKSTVKKTLKESYENKNIEEIIRRNVSIVDWAKMMAQHDVEMTDTDFDDSFNEMINDKTYFDDCIYEFIEAMKSGYFEKDFETPEEIIKEFIEFSPYYFEWDE